MMTTESWPRSAVRILAVTQRFQKFVAVGAIGLAVNQVMLIFLAEFAAVRLAVASPVAILFSMIVTFGLNEMWTWHDRGGGPVMRRAILYGAINSGGLLINWGLLLWLENAGMHYLFANLVGAGIAAFWNFGLNHVITWRDHLVQ